MIKSMYTIRLARKGEILRQKEIWKLCFGDSDSFIDFYYTYRYKEDETAVLLDNQEIIAMLTMMPVKTVFPDKGSADTAMIYAVATHPGYRKRGGAAQLMSFSHQYLKKNKVDLSVLVPAGRKLFDYYQKQGYEQAFYLKETLLSREAVDALPVSGPFECEISAIASPEYNRLRKEQLRDRLYISYADEDIGYQKKLSQLSGTDIYGISVGEAAGCFAAERMTPEKLLIKEILIPEPLLNPALKQIAKELPAREYTIRTPSYLGENLEGSVRPFGMSRILSKGDLRISPEDQGYLGLAFD